MGKPVLQTRRGRDACAVALALCASVASMAYASDGAAGISPQSVPAVLDLQQLERRARAGDKRAQFALGRRYETGDGVTADQRRAIALYRAAAADTGGTRMMHVPQSNGSVSSIPVDAGPLVPGLPEAGAALARLEGRDYGPARSHAAAVASLRAPEGGSGSGAIFSGSVGSVFQTIVKIEMFSDKCLVRGKSYDEDLDIYAEKGWRCLLDSELPGDCASYPAAILRSVRFVRFHPNFVTLHQSMPGVIEKCLATYKGSIQSAYDGVRYAGILDLALNGLGHATDRQKELARNFEGSDAAHSYAPNLPGFAFSDRMCGKLARGGEIEQANFWFLFCDNVHDGYAGRADRSEAIDKLMHERGLGRRLIMSQPDTD